MNNDIFVNLINISFLLNLFLNQYLISNFFYLFKHNEFLILLFFFNNITIDQPYFKLIILYI